MRSHTNSPNSPNSPCSRSSCHLKAAGDLAAPERHSGVESSKRDENAEICVAAAGVVQSLFHTLCQTDGIRCLWMSIINCLFSALVQLSTEIRISNPLLAISALRRYDSALVSLKELAEYWPNAKSILHFFENSVRINSQLQDSHGVSHLSNEDPENQEDALQQSTIHHTTKDNEEVMDGSQRRPDELNDPSAWGATEDTNEPGDLNSTGAILDSWRQWQSHHWHTPEFSDEYLFTF